MKYTIEPKGTQSEQDLFMRVRSNYDRSRKDLDIRRKDFDKKDELFRTYINPKNWPYKAEVADPSVFTFITEKTSRLISNKLRGIVKPRQAGDWLKAKINNELLDYQWDLATEGGSMIQKWALLDQNARKYGSGFGLCKWHWEREYGTTKELASNPEFEVIPNRDALYNPDHSEIRKWFQVRRWVTLDEMKNINDIAIAAPRYKNLDILAQSLKEEEVSGDRRDTAYISRNKSIKGLQDTLGASPYEKYVEIITQYTPTRIVRFSPKHGVILQDEVNPYREIPIVHLKYYVIDDDLYGLSEIEPIEKLQKVENALISQFLDTVNTDLYPPLLVRATGVQMHTLEFGPNKKWLMTDPSTDVQRFQTSTAAVSQFTSTISFIISRMQNAMGETSEGLSNINPLGGKRTATEIRDSAVQRLARDNFNQIFLAEAIKKQMLLWMKMNAKYVTKNMILQIMSNESLAFLKQNMLVPPQPGQIDPMTGQPAQPSPNGADMQGNFGQGAPIYPVQQGKEVVPKFQMDQTGDMGILRVEPKDLDGLYDYIPDVESMSIQNNEQSKQKLTLLQEIIASPVMLQLLQMEGQKPKVAELLTEAMEDVGFRDAKRFFEQADQGQQAGGLPPQIGVPNGQAQAVVPPGAGAPQGLIPGGGNGSLGGLPQAGPPNPGGQAQPIIPGP